MFPFVVILFLALLAAPSSANAELRVSAFTVGQSYYHLNGQTLSMEASPFISNNRIYAPVQYLVNSIGAQSDSLCIGSDGTIIIEANNKTLVFTIGSNIFTVNGESRIMESPPLFMNGIAFLPIVYVTTQYGGAVNWSPETQMITIVWSDGQPEKAPSVSDAATKRYTWTYNGDDWFWDVPRDIENESAILKYYRSKPHPQRTEMDYITSYCMDTDDDRIIGTIVNKLKESAVEKGYNKYQTVEFVAAFVQGVPYVLDSVSTGFDDYPRYPVETLEDGKGDCEDTAILAATLIREMGYGAALIFLPGHCAVGVKGNETVAGSYYEVNGTRYYYLETTAKGWPIGVIPEDYKNSKALVLPLP